jgi:hypothetical protein
LPNLFFLAGVSSGVSLTPVFVLNDGLDSAYFGLVRGEHNERAKVFNLKHTDSLATIHPRFQRQINNFGFLS